jgi:hypothetical protein
MILVGTAGIKEKGGDGIKRRALEIQRERKLSIKTGQDFRWILSRAGCIMRT